MKKTTTAAISLASFGFGAWVTAKTSKRVLQKQAHILDLAGRVLLRYIDLADYAVSEQIWDEFAFEIVTRDMTPRDPRKKN